MRVCAQVAFSKPVRRGLFELKKNDLEVVGLTDYPGWTATLNLKMEEGMSFKVKLLKEGNGYPAIGTAKDGVDQAEYLLSQRGTISLTSTGVLYVDGSRKRGGLPKFNDGDVLIVALIASTVTFSINGQVVAEEPYDGTPISLAVSGMKGTTWELLQVTARGGREGGV